MTPIYDATVSAAPFERSPAAQANRRRRRVFFWTFLLACIASLAWVYMRPAQYEATARWQFVFSERPQARIKGQAQASNQGPQDGFEPAFLTQLQVITSRPLLKKLDAELHTNRITLPAVAGDSVDALQQALRVRAVPGTTIVEVAAEGLWAEPLAPTINTLFELYRRELDSGHRSRSDDSWAKARDEAAALQLRAAERRSDVDAFRARHNIVSLQRDENEVLSQLKGQSTSLNLANEKMVAAEARLKSLRASVAAGGGAVRARDDPTVAGIEKRLSEAREEVRLMERKFTEAYMNLDPNARDLRLRVTNLEEQLKQARGASQKSTLSEAEAEYAAANAAVERLSRDIGGSRRGVQTFTARMAEYKAMQEGLDQLEEQKGAAVARATELEMGSRRAAPAVNLLEPASTPTSPASPNYTRDAGIAVGGSLLLGLLMMGFVELFNRPEPSPHVVLMERGWGPLGPAHSGARPIAFDNHPVHALPASAAPPMTPPLLATPGLPRELRDDEIAALLRASGESTRLLVMLLLSGITAEEATALKWGDVDLALPAVRLPDRLVPLAPPCASMLTSLAVHGRTPSKSLMFGGADGQRRSAEDIDADVVCAAHDAGLTAGAEIKAATLHHTCVAHLVRQGARFGDLSRWVGRLPPDALGIVVQLAPDGPKRPAEAIDPVHPALRRASAAVDVEV